MGLPEETIRNLRQPAPAPPRLYGLPKIHKDGIPLRPIVNAIGSPTYNLAKYLTGVLSPYVGHCEHHIKNSTEFVKILAGIRLKETDLLVSLDVVSLFTRVPLDDTLRLLAEKFDGDTVQLFRHVLNSTYFQYHGEFYEQSDGVAMGSPLSPTIANFFMEDFEEKALSSAPLKPLLFLRYVDDTFVVWPHGRRSLDEFFDHMNCQHSSIKFTMEIEENNRLPFLDVLVSRRTDGTLGHSVYRKPTHTDLYLHGRSHHHPSQRMAVMKSLFHRAVCISDKDSLAPELKRLRKTFQQNGYDERQISKALKRTISKTNSRREDGERDDRTAKACLPYISSVSGKVARILKRFNIQAIHKPPKKIRDMLVKAKDPGVKIDGKKMIFLLR
ncbi:uncharacterized protein LOC124163008 [Ischnura elegans]|uniref:uncharacterized protein LOC124163008 n=1 Tax=Ischnura elegans TaxID=197161 RepID=UPI001ED871E7|nr:uncharacterized protein LOC124163008 [Ischnura elegans]